MIVNQRIKNELNARGMSQYELSKRTGIGESTISKWFQAVPTNPSPKSLKKVAKVFGMTLSQLMGEDKIEQDPQKQEFNENWNRLSTAEKDTVINVMKAIINHR